MQVLVQGVFLVNFVQAHTHTKGGLMHAHKTNEFDR